MGNLKTQWIIVGIGFCLLFFAMFSLSASAMENFDSYANGQSIITANPTDWKKLSTTEYPIVTNSKSSSSPNSLQFTATGANVKAIVATSTSVHLDFSIYCDLLTSNGFKMEMWNDTTWKGGAYTFYLSGTSTPTVLYNDGNGSTTFLAILSLDTWYDFRIDLDYENAMTRFGILVGDNYNYLDWTPMTLITKNPTTLGINALTNIGFTTNTDDIYIDNLELSLPYGGDFNNNYVEWVFPLDDLEVNNTDDAWWTVNAGVAQEDVGDYQVLRITYQDNETGDYWGEIGLLDFGTSTTEVQWNLERCGNAIYGMDWETQCLTNGHIEFENGHEISATAELFVTRSCNSEEDFYVGNCLIESISETSTINFIASSTGFDIFDFNEFGGYGTTTDYTKTEGDTLMSKLKNIWSNSFPISILMDIKEVAKNALIADESNAPVNLTLHQLVPSKYTEDYASTTVLSADILEDNLPQWNSLIYPTMQKFIYAVLAVYILVRITYNNKGSEGDED